MISCGLLNNQCIPRSGASPTVSCAGVRRVARCRPRRETPETTSCNLTTDVFVSCGDPQWRLYRLPAANGSCSSGGAAFRCTRTPRCRPKVDTVLLRATCEEAPTPAVVQATRTDRLASIAALAVCWFL